MILLKENLSAELRFYFLCFDVYNCFPSSSFSFIRSVLFEWHALNLSRRSLFFLLSWICLAAYKGAELCVSFVFSNALFWWLPFIRDQSVSILSDCKFLRWCFWSLYFLIFKGKSFWLNRFRNRMNSIHWLLVSFHNTWWAINESWHHANCSISTIASCLVSIWMRGNCLLASYFRMNHVVDCWFLWSKFLLTCPWLAT